MHMVWLQKTSRAASDACSSSKLIRIDYQSSFFPFWRSLLLTRSFASTSRLSSVSPPGRARCSVIWLLAECFLLWEVWVLFHLLYLKCWKTSQGKYLHHWFFFFFFRASAAWSDLRVIGEFLWQLVRIMAPNNTVFTQTLLSAVPLSQSRPSIDSVPLFW